VTIRVNYIYFGQIKDIRLRLQRHNHVTNSLTRNGRFWETTYFEVCFTREIVINCEKEMKKFTTSELKSVFNLTISDLKNLYYLFIKRYTLSSTEAIISCILYKN
jgi:predicted GIY-YIG superfamily endonuclease